MNRFKHIVLPLTAALLLPDLAANAQSSIRDDRVSVSLEPVATGLTAPNWGTSAPGCPSLADRLVVTDQDGILWAINVTTGDKSVLLDVSGLLVDLGVGGPGTFDERGLLGVAFHPDYPENGLLYTYTSEPVEGTADYSTMPAMEMANHQSVIREWQMPEPCHPDSVVDPETSREVLRIDQPQFNHNAGALVFGPDDMLYVALGDGGGADDQGVGHVPGGNAQNPGNILGSILRIDPDGDNSENGQYGIPADNPFVGVMGVLGEIYAYGLRNPFRFSFDSKTGDMYIADVGQNDIEEVNLGVAGGNYGWNIKEGTFCFDPNGDDSGFAYLCGPNDDTSGLIDPIAEYDHDEGIAVVGGFVYRGDDIRSLRGTYVFGDHSAPGGHDMEEEEDHGGGRLFYLANDHRIFEFDLAGEEHFDLALLGFGQDAQGELYVLANITGTPSGDTGVVLALAEAERERARGRGRGNAPGRSEKFRASLSGENEVPEIETKARGKAFVRATDDGLHVRLIVANIEDVTAAHIHCAEEGANGSVGVTLFTDGPVTGSGVLVETVITNPDEGNACGWEDMQDVMEAINRGEAYINVHTSTHGSGEIRGQLR